MTRRLARRDGRPGFTLIELLVAIGIFLTLSAIVIGSFDAVNGGAGDRVPEAARALTAALEGAKQRAAKLGRPVGLRAIIEDTPAALNGHLVREFEYVAEPDPTSGSPLDGTSGWLAMVEEVRLVDTTGSGRPPIRQWRAIQLVEPPDATAAAAAAGASVSAVPWSRIDGGDFDGDGIPDEPDLIRPGRRIYIGASGQGAWYTIAGDDLRTAG